jgi:hypothetical protein
MENNNDYEIMYDGYSHYDLSFKVIIIGNSGNIVLIKGLGNHV